MKNNTLVNEKTYIIGNKKYATTTYQFQLQNEPGISVFFEVWMGIDNVVYSCIKHGVMSGIHAFSFNIPDWAWNEFNRIYNY